MTFDKPFAKTSLLIAVAALLIVGVLSLSQHETGTWAKWFGRNTLASDLALFSPGSNLEDKDLEVLSTAKYTVDIAMYSFTDPQIETLVESLAKRGVKIRIYRDGLQFSDEEGRALRRGEASVMDQLHGQSGIEIKIKNHGKSMHLKSYCVDQAVLRTGSANWSSQGETEQDNDLYLVKETDAIRKFEHEFDQMWSRSDNQTF